MEADVGGAIRANTQQVLKTFIEEYKCSPELWDPSNVDYTNKYRRVEAQDRLLGILKIIQSDANRIDVRKKINTLRSNYNKEMGKIKNAEAEGREYNPRSWLFPELRFLDSIKKLEFNNDLSDNEASGDVDIESNQVKTEGTYSGPIATEFIEIANRTELQTILQNPTPVKHQTTPQINQKTTGLDKRIPSVNRKHRISNSIERCQPIRKLHQKNSARRMPIQSLPSCSYSTGIDPIALVWSSKLQGLKQTQRLYAEKAINDILFEASMNNLGKGPVVINSGISSISAVEADSYDVEAPEYIEYSSTEDDGDEG